jgi:uncharacterized protein YPO0396
MGNAYAIIQSRSELEFLYLRAQIILSEQVFLQKKHLLKQKYFPNWLHVLKARSARANHGDLNDEIRQIIKAQLKSQSDALTARLEALENDLAARMSSKVKSSKHLLSEEIADLKKHMKL